MTFSGLFAALRHRNADPREGALVSEAETICQDGEPFDIFKHKVEELILQEFPGYNADDILLEDLRGGSYNRIVAIKLCKPENSPLPAVLTNARKSLSKRFPSSDPRRSRPGDELILRAPRTSSVDKSMWFNVTTLAFLARRLPYPIPKVLQYDILPTNPLGQGYMIQERLPGRPLVDMLNTGLIVDNLFKIAQEICQIVVSISNITHNTAGFVGLGTCPLDFDDGNFSTTPQHLQGQIEQSLNDIDLEPCKPQTTVEMLLEFCERRRKLESDAQEEVNNEIWDGFVRIIRKLHGLGFLPDDDKFHFCHRDFQPRNMLVETRNESPIITGIIDWDSAAFVPKFVSMRAPFFLWGGYNDDEWDEYMAVNNPKSYAEKECKMIFEKTVGPEFLRYAYSREYIIARQIFNAIEKGIYTRYAKRAAMKIIADFEKAWPSL